MSDFPTLAEIACRATIQEWTDNLTAADETDSPPDHIQMCFLAIAKIPQLDDELGRVT